MLGKTENLIIILIIILVLFGAKKLPELARSLGQSVKEVRKGFEETGKSDAQAEEKSETQA